MPVLFEWLQAWPAKDVVDEPHALGRVSRRVLWAVAISCSVLASYVIVSEQYAWGAVIGIALAFALLCLVKPQLALLIFLIYLPIEGALKKVGIDLSVMRGVNPETFVTLLYAVICIPRVLISAKPSRLSSRLILPMLLLSVLLLFSIAWNPHLGTDIIIDDLAKIKQVTFYFLTFFLVMVTPDKRRYLNLYLGVFFLVCAYLSLDAVLVSMGKATFTNLGISASRSVGGLDTHLGSVQTSPLVLGLGATFLTAISLETKSTFWLRILLLSGTGIFVLSSLLFLSRGMSGAVIMGVLVTLLASGVSRRNAWILLVIPLLLWFLIPENLTVRFERSLSGTGSLTTARAEEAWPDAIETISEYPILGVGYGAYSAKRAAHNQLLDMWVQVGIGGVILFLWMYVSLVRVAWRARHDGDSRGRAIANGLFGQLMGCVIALMVSDSFFHPWLAYSLFFIAVLLEPVGRATLGQKSVPGWRKRSLSAAGIG